MFFMGGEGGGEEGSDILRNPPLPNPLLPQKAREERGCACYRGGVHWTILRLLCKIRSKSIHTKEAKIYVSS
jgi:hypothetical protein